MKSWKKRLKDEFDCVVPALGDELKNAPIMTSQEDISDAECGNTLVKRKIGIGSACAAIVIAITFALLGIFGVFSPATSPAAPPFDKFVFTLEINPAVSFITDTQGTVKNVNALNADADVVLSDGNTLQKLKDVPISQAVVTFTDSAAKLGYIDIKEETNAVRLSSSTETDETLIATASDSLRDYFKTNGIYSVVLEEVTTVKNLSARLGISENDNLSSLINSLENLSVRFGERVGNDINAAYESYILGTQMLNFVRDELLKNLDAVIKDASMLAEMSALNSSIMSHPDNTTPFIKDFWSTKQNFDGQYPDELATLMNRMEDRLSEYESTFGVRLENIFDLIAATNVYSSLDGKDFETIFTSLSSADFIASGQKFVEILKQIGCDVRPLELLLNNAPKTAEEYLVQTQIVLKQLYDSRTERFKDIYEQPRAEISDTDYASFIENVILEYGSLENFWDKK